MTLKWYDGGRFPERPAGMEPDRRINEKGGTYVIGDQGALYIPGMRPDWVKEEAGTAWKPN